MEFNEECLFEEAILQAKEAHTLSFAGLVEQLDKSNSFFLMQLYEDQFFPMYTDSYESVASQCLLYSRLIEWKLSIVSSEYMIKLADGIFQVLVATPIHSMNEAIFKIICETIPLLCRSAFPSNNTLEKLNQLMENDLIVNRVLECIQLIIPHAPPSEPLPCLSKVLELYDNNSKFRSYDKCYVFFWRCIVTRPTEVLNSEKLFHEPLPILIVIESLYLKHYLTLNCACRESIFRYFPFITEYDNINIQWFQIFLDQYSIYLHPDPAINLAGYWYSRFPRFQTIGRLLIKEIKSGANIDCY